MQLRTGARLSRGRLSPPGFSPKYPQATENRPRDGCHSFVAANFAKLASMRFYLNYAFVQRNIRLREEIRDLGRQTPDVRHHLPVGGRMNPQAEILEKAYLLQLRLELERLTDGQIEVMDGTRNFPMCSSQG